MAAVTSTMLELGTEAPFFRLPDTSGRIITLDDYQYAPALLVMFLCNHCPFVKHVSRGIVQLTDHYQLLGLGIVGINSNDPRGFPDDSPGCMSIEAARRRYTFPYLFDETQEVAKAYRAACTPDFFLFDRERRLVYRGQMDDSRPDNHIPVTGKDLRAAIDAMLAGEPVPEDQKPSVGCNIKWKPGNTPDWFQ